MSSQPPPHPLPEDAAPAGRKAPPADRKFPCPQCGGKLTFDPSGQALKCPYCGHTVVIHPESKEIRELDFEDYLQRLAGRETTIEGRSSQVTCTGCGAVLLLQDQVATDTCPYCATHLENQPESAEAMIAPEAVLPFKVSNKQAIESFNQWISSRWFAPSALYKLANLGLLAGVYVPFWTYDSMTYTHYTGQRGDDYQEIEPYYETNAQGQQEMKTRTVTRTRWTFVSGRVDHFFDDVLICASKSLAAWEVQQLSPWELKALLDFRAEYLSGFKTERYAVDLADGFEHARAIMDAEIRRLCERDIGGNHQQLMTVDTQHVGVTFKHILLPVWLGSYRYQNKSYRVLINARTGRATGTRPYSWVKIVAFIVAIVLALLLVFLIIRGFSRGTTGSRHGSGVVPNAGRAAERPRRSDLRFVSQSEPRRTVESLRPPMAWRPPRGIPSSLSWPGPRTLPGAPTREGAGHRGATPIV
jgi:DNA-directed RNA polymerase subunit RPC12/RpoP